MKIHTKKKVFRAMCKELAKAGKINNADGQWINRPSGNAMMRDYSPQGGK